MTTNNEKVYVKYTQGGRNRRVGPLDQHSAKKLVSKLFGVPTVSFVSFTRGSTPVKSPITVSDDTGLYGLSIAYMYPSDVPIVFFKKDYDIMSGHVVGPYREIKGPHAMDAYDMLGIPDTGEQHTADWYEEMGWTIKDRDDLIKQVREFELDHQ